MSKTPPPQQPYGWTTGPDGRPLFAPGGTPPPAPKGTWFDRHKVATALMSTAGLITVIAALATAGSASDAGQPSTAAKPSAAASSHSPASTSSAKTHEAPATTAEAKTKPAAQPVQEEPEPAKPSMTTAQSNAVRKAESYLEYAAFSRKGLIQQLEFEGFSASDATYGVDHVDVNWKTQAAKKAASYLENTAFSRSGLIQQLEFEGFTRAQAKYGAAAAGL